MMLKQSLAIIVIFATFSVSAGTLTEDVEELIDLLRLEEDIKNQYENCISGSAKVTEAEILHEMQDEYSDLNLDSEDLELLLSIYSEFYHYGCAYLAGDEIPNFYRIELKKRFTHAEIKSLIEFYKTPLGVKLNSQWIKINKEFGGILNERHAADSFEAQRRFEERMESFWNHLEKKAVEESLDKGA